MDASYKGTNKMITGIVFGVITFWLFAQSMVNVVPAIQEDLGVSLGGTKYCNQFDRIVLRYFRRSSGWTCR